MFHASLNRIASLSLFTLLTTATVASAHPGHGALGLTSGLAHPVTGLDHVLAMVGVGLLAAGLGGRWVWTLPATFVSSMLLGAALGAAGLFVPSWLAETGMAGSVLAFGLLISLGTPLPASFVAGLTGLFAVCHGSAHAAEMPPGSSVWAFFVGFTISTVFLHAAGVAIGLGVARQGSAAAVRVCGAAMSVCGGLMLVGVL